MTASHDRAQADGTRPSAAVLYFTTGGAGDLSHLACGITEDVISRLGRVSGLSVSSRHDVIPLRGRTVDTDELGRCMDVGFVLRAQVRPFAEGIAVEARLEAAGRARGPWVETLERPHGGIFDLAPAAALWMVGTIGAAISPSEEKQVSARLTANDRAYDLHARGRDFLTRRGRKSTEAALGMFEDAVRADPGFAAAHESTAAACSGMFTYYDGSDAWLERTAAAARRALELDAGLVEARFHLGVVALHRRAYDSARAAFEEILRIRPGHYEAHQWLGILFDMTGEHDAALECYRKSAEIKPCSVEPWLYINMTQRRRGDAHGATEAARRFLEVGLKTLQIMPDDPVTLSRFCVIYTLFDEKEKAHETLERILRSGTEDGLVLYNCAATYALLGDDGESLECLRKALGGGYKNVRDWIETDPDFDRIRGSDGYRNVIREFDALHAGESQ